MNSSIIDEHIVHLKISLFTVLLLLGGGEDMEIQVILNWRTSMTTKRDSNQLLSVRQQVKRNTLITTARKKMPIVPFQTQ